MAKGTKSVHIGNGEFNSHLAISPGTAQVVAAASASSTMSAAVGSNSYLARVSSDVAVFIAIGSSPTATRSTSMHLPAGVVETVVVSPADKIAALADTAVGRLFICEAVSVG